MENRAEPTPEENISLLELLLSFPEDMDEFTWTIGIGEGAVKGTYSRIQLEEVLFEEQIKLEYESK